MKLERGSTVVIMLGVIASAILFGVICIAAYVSAVNYGNEAEQGIIATHENNRNILAQYSQKVAEAAQVPTMMRDDLKEVMQATLQARYGANGSTAAMQWIKEQNPSLEPKLYIQIQRIIEAGRDEFQRNQTSLIDKVRAYKTQLGYFWRGFWLRAAGLPKINFDNYKAITNDYSDDAFKRGKESSPIQLRPTK